MDKGATRIGVGEWLFSKYTPVLWGVGSPGMGQPEDSVNKKEQRKVLSSLKQSRGKEAVEVKVNVKLNKIKNF